MSTKKHLEWEVDRLNRKYCRDTKNQFRVQSAYGGYQVQLTGKPYANNPNRYRGMGTRVLSVTPRFTSASDTLNVLHSAEKQGILLEDIMRAERMKSTSTKRTTRKYY